MEAAKLIKMIEELDYNNPRDGEVATDYETACFDIIVLIEKMEKERWGKMAGGLKPSCTVDKPCMNCHRCSPEEIWF